MTTDEQFKHYYWNAAPVRKQCCAKDKHEYMREWKPIIQICVLGEEFLIRMDYQLWDIDELDHCILKGAEKSSLSAFAVQDAIRDLQKYKFEDVFVRHAGKPETTPCVDPLKIWLLNTQIQLPEWDWELLCSVVKHCRRT
jgi:hypothetical protein